jgi:site-specific recombinase XerD
VQQILGHSSILTTARYTHLTQSTGRNAEQAIDVRINALSSNCGVRR